jgi:hypothetical protein
LLAGFAMRTKQGYHSNVLVLAFCLFVALPSVSQQIPNDKRPPTAQAEQSTATPTPSETDAETQRKLAKFTKYLVWVGALQFAALILQAVVFYCTLNQIDRQAGIMEGHSQHLKDLATAASNNALAASLSAQAVINSERPWMIIELTPIPGVPKEGYVTFRAWNRGRTPAEILAYQGNFFFHGYDEDFKPDPTFKPLETRYRICISPGNSIELYGFSLTGSLPPDQWEWMEKERKYLYFYGNIVYKSLISYEEHESRFCYWLSPVPGVGLIMGGDRNWNKYT